jgi:hypothetical protein
MILGPVTTDEHPGHHHVVVVTPLEPEATSSLPMVQCSKHVMPRAIQVDLADQQPHDPERELHVPRTSVPTRWRLGTILTRDANEVVDPH